MVPDRADLTPAMRNGYRELEDLSLRSVLAGAGSERIV
jgi:hypothetical protein